MSLDVNTLRSAIFAAFKKAKETPPGDPNKADQLQAQILTQLAQNLSAAVQNFVRSGDVVQVEVQFTDPTTNKLITAKQTGTGKIQ